MSNEDRDMLVGQMERALARVIQGIDALDYLNTVDAHRADWEDVPEEFTDYFEDLCVDGDDWHAESAYDRVTEDLDPLSFTWEKDEPFDVALALGGPNIYLVDFGGHGGAQLRGYWGETHVMTGADVTRALEWYKEDIREIFGD